MRNHVLKDCRKPGGPAYKEDDKGKSEEKKKSDDSKESDKGKEKSGKRRERGWIKSAECHECGEKGHIRPTCPKRSEDAKMGVYFETQDEEKYLEFMGECCMMSLNSSGSVSPIFRNTGKTSNPASSRRTRSLSGHQIM